MTTSTPIQCAGTEMPSVQPRAPRAWALRVLPVLLVALLGVYWPTIAEIARRCGSESQYSHGLLVPLFSLYLLWTRRDVLAGAGAPTPSWWGLPVLALGLALRFAGVFAYFDWLSAAALLPTLAGVCLLVGGLRALVWAWPALLFLVFMIPLPFSVETALAHPLQRLATKASAYALQTLGLLAFTEGNVIVMGEVRLGVVQACSGLAMLVTFFALSSAVVLVSTRPPLERGLLFISAVPIALVVNITRIVVTGVLHKTVGSELADYVFHDLAGWLMMPMALGLLWAELRLLDWVLVQRPTEDQAFSAFAWGAAPGGQVA
jgi:exosortase